MTCLILLSLLPYTTGVALKLYSFRHRPEVLERIKRDAQQQGIQHTIHTRNLVDAALTRDDGRELQLLRLAVQDQTAKIEALTAQQEEFYQCFIESVEDILINQALPPAERLRIPFIRKKSREWCLRLGIPYTPPLEE